MKNDWGFENNTGSCLCFAEEGGLGSLDRGRILKDALPKLNISPENNIISPLFDLGQVSTTSVTWQGSDFLNWTVWFGVHFLKGRASKRRKVTAFATRRTLERVFAVTLHIRIWDWVLCVQTHHVGVERRSDPFVVEVIPVDRREEGVVLYF